MPKRETTPITGAVVSQWAMAGGIRDSSITSSHYLIYVLQKGHISSFCNNNYNL